MNLDTALMPINQDEPNYWQAFSVELTNSAAGTHRADELLGFWVTRTALENWEADLVRGLRSQLEAWIKSEYSDDAADGNLDWDILATKSDIAINVDVVA